MILTYFALAYSAWTASASRRWRRGVGYALLAASVLTLLGGDDPMKLLFGEAGSDRAAAYGTTFWNFLTVWVLAVVATRKLRDRLDPYEGKDPAESAASSVETEDSVAEATSPARAVTT
jgi:hypothetical protein